MNGHAINYEHLAKEALRSVVKTVLQRVAKEGLPGDHHFYISFHTTAPGVKISNRISAQYPKEMTIVLQHQFWDLKAEDEHFEVRLSFSNIPELLIIPYSAVKVFFDPSVPYGLQFDHTTRPEAVEDKSNFLDENWQMPTDNNDQALDGMNLQPNLDLQPNFESDLQANSLNTNEADAPIPDQAEGNPAKSESNEESHSPNRPEATQDETAPDDDGAEIVSLDAFRKKNS